MNIPTFTEPTAIINFDDVDRMDLGIMHSHLEGVGIKGSSLRSIASKVFCAVESTFETGEGEVEVNRGEIELLYNRIAHQGRFGTPEGYAMSVLRLKLERAFKTLTEMDA